MSTETKPVDWRPLPRAGSRVILTGAAGGMGRALFTRSPRWAAR